VRIGGERKEMEGERKKRKERGRKGRREEEKEGERTREKDVYSEAVWVGGLVTGRQF
jgi:hypothetical protein